VRRVRSTGSRTKSPGTAIVPGLRFGAFRLLHLMLAVRAVSLALST